MSTLLVTGISGALGSRLATRLGVDEGVETIVGVDVRPLTASAPKLRFVHTSVGEADMGSLLRGVDTVVHLARADVPVLRKLLDASAEHGVRRFVLTSSAAAYGAWPTNAVPLAEDAPLRPNPGFDYAVELAEQERLIAEWSAANPEARVVVLRLAMVLGGGFEKALSVALGTVRAQRSSEGSPPLQFLHIDDAVSAIAMAATGSLEGTFNVAPRGFVTEAAARAIAGVPPRPALPRRMAHVVNDLVWRRLYRSDFASAEPYLRYPWVMSSDRLQGAGWEPSYTSEEALAAEATPSWWGGLRTGQRRNIVSGSVVAASAGAAAGAAGGVAVLVRRSRRR